MARHTTTTTSGTTGSKGNKAGLALTAILVPLHILVFTALLIMCAIVFNNYANGGTMLDSVSALWTVIFSLLAGSVGLATMIMAAVHGGERTESAKHSSLAANLVTFALVALAFGFACKCAHNKPYNGYGGIGNLLIAIIAFDIFLGLGMLLYLAHLGLFKHDNNTYNDRTYTTNNTATSNHPGCINDTNTTGKGFVAGHEQQRAMHA